MAKFNFTQVTEFILKGITDRPELQAPLFLIFLVIYTVTVVGNLGLITLIRMDSRLHTPMYFFLSHLAFVDFSYASTVTPKMLVHFVVDKNTISFNACAAQVGCFVTFVIAECFILASMAYDRYVAICNPLLYLVVMSQKLCIQIVAVAYTYSFLGALTNTIVTFRLSYCGSNVINNFYCDDVALLPLSCSNTYTKQMMIFVFAGFNIISSSMIIIISYIFIIASILRIHSAEGRLKAFSTCGSHMVAVTIFYGTLIFMYLLPKSKDSLDTDKITSVFYTMVIPMLNPLIYSLRNKDVKEALKKAGGKGCEKLKKLQARK
ncbi:olfactory receptor 1038-like [Monodelphis domestica]|uniref:olfactory receptor 1038-like n=1 Tax=Monodelphis domestica TaxID=13616 RepID=UPI0024E1F9E5|nr:olfactory receptor 1038-like [Monodelphis domestica]